MVINHLLTGMILEVGKIRSSSRPSQRGGLYWTSDDFDCLCRIFLNNFEEFDDFENHSAAGFP